MEFLKQRNKEKTLRTVLYGDQIITLFELEVIHTPVFQRLYDLKQLGFADKIYPDAVHSRFNHAIGTVEIVTRMCHQLQSWINKNPELLFKYWDDNNKSLQCEKNLTSKELELILEQSIPTIRLIALLHDLPHFAIGHTLEDEISVFKESHDEPSRQAKYFDVLIAQLIIQWYHEVDLPMLDVEKYQQVLEFNIDTNFIKTIFEEVYEKLGENSVELLNYLIQLDTAMRMLLLLEEIHPNESNSNSIESSNKESKESNTPSLLISDIISLIDGTNSYDIQLYRDCWMLDLVGNTICADLIDYSNRDTHFTGLKSDFDERLLKYLVLVSTDGDLGIKHKSTIRPAIQFFTNKLRNDVLTEMSSILKLRYKLHERVLYHPTKCAVGSLLGSMIQLLGLRVVPNHLLALGDSVIMYTLRNVAMEVQQIKCLLEKEEQGSMSIIELKKHLQKYNDFSELAKECTINILEDENKIESDSRNKLTRLKERADASLRLYWKISARRFPDLVFRLHQDNKIIYKETKDEMSVSEVFSNPNRRYKLERDLEKDLSIPLGSISIHCPKKNSSLKIAKALVVGKDLGKVTELHNLADLNEEWKNKLQLYNREFEVIEDMYSAIWRFHIFIDPAHFDKWPLVEHFMKQNYTPTVNDNLLTSALEEQNGNGNIFYILERKFSTKIPEDSFPKVVEKLSEKALGRFSDNIENDINDIIEQIINEVISDQLPKINSRRSLDKKKRKG